MISVLEGVGSFVGLVRTAAKPLFIVRNHCPRLKETVELWDFTGKRLYILVTRRVSFCFPSLKRLRRPLGLLTVHCILMK